MENQISSLFNSLVDLIKIITEKIEVLFLPLWHLVVKFITFVGIPIIKLIESAILALKELLSGI